MGIKLVPQLVNFHNRHFNIMLSLCMLVALALRVTALLNYQHSIYARFLVWDESTYQHWAIKLVQSNFSVSAIPEFAPLPAYVMALLYKMFAAKVIVYRIFNVLISTITCYLLYLIGAALAGRTVGLLSCLFAACYAPFIFFSFTLLKTSLSLFLFALAICLLLSSYRVASKSKMMLMAGAIGLLVNVRPNMIVVLFYLPAAVLWHWYGKGLAWKRLLTLLLCYVSGVIFVVGPFSVMQYKGTGKGGLTVTGGFNLYIANNLQNPYPYYRPVSFAVSIPSRQGKDFMVEASRRVGRKLTQEEASHYFIHEVERSAFEHPFIFGRKIFLKILALFNHYEAADNYHIGFMSNFIGIFKLPFLSFWVVLSLGMAGFVATFNKSELSRSWGVYLFFMLVLSLYFLQMLNQSTTRGNVNSDVRMGCLYT